MKYTRKDFAIGIECIMSDLTLRSVTVFCGNLSDVKQRIRFTRRGNDSIIITYGKPNYGEREFLKLCQKAKCKPRRLRFTYAKRTK